MSRKIKILLSILIPVFVSIGCGDKVVERAQIPPGIPSSPFPASGSADQDVSLELRWQFENRSGFQIEFDIYMGTGIEMPLIGSGLSLNSYPIDSLDHNTIYLWKVVARDANLNETSGHVWNFTTRRAPGIYPVGDLILQGSGYKLLVRENLAFIAQSFDWPYEWSHEISIVDISVPENPQFVGQYVDSTGLGDLCVYSNFIFAVSYSDDLIILDISDASSPLLVTSFELRRSSFGIFVRDDIAYVTGYYGMDIIDVSDPINPVSIAFYEYPFGRSKVLISGNYAYVTVYVGGLHIIDISNPTAPVPAGTYPTEGPLYNVFVHDYIAYLDLAHKMLILDISDKSAPNLIRDYSIDGVIYLYNDLIYSRYYNVLTLLDVSDAANPQELFTYETQSSFKSVAADDRYIYALNNGIGFTLLEYEP